MWQNLTPDDIQHAKAELKTRHEEMLARHAAELEGLDADLAEVETLADLAARFAQKLKSIGTPANAPAPEPTLARRRDASEKTTPVNSASAAHSLYVGIR